MSQRVFFKIKHFSRISQRVLLKDYFRFQTNLLKLIQTRHTESALYNRQIIDKCSYVENFEKRSSPYKRFVNKCFLISVLLLFSGKKTDKWLMVHKLWKLLRAPIISSFEWNYMTATSFLVVSNEVYYIIFGPNILTVH